MNSNVSFDQNPTKVSLNLSHGQQQQEFTPMNPAKLEMHIQKIRSFWEKRRSSMKTQGYEDSKPHFKHFINRRDIEDSALALRNKESYQRNQDSRVGTNANFTKLQSKQANFNQADSTLKPIPGIRILSEVKNQKTFSHVRIGNKLEHKRFQNMTTSSSAYTAKIESGVQSSNGIRIIQDSKTISKQMKKTNLILGMRGEPMMRKENTNQCSISRETSPIFIKEVDLNNPSQKSISAPFQYQDKNKSLDSKNSINQQDFRVSSIKNRRSTLSTIQENQMLRNQKFDRVRTKIVSGNNKHIFRETTSIETYKNKLEISKLPITQLKQMKATLKSQIESSRKTHFVLGNDQPNHEETKNKYKSQSPFDQLDKTEILQKTELLRKNAFFNVINFWKQKQVQITKSLQQNKKRIHKNESSNFMPHKKYPNQYVSATMEAFNQDSLSTHVANQESTQLPGIQGQRKPNPFSTLPKQRPTIYDSNMKLSYRISSPYDFKSHSQDIHSQSVHQDLNTNNNSPFISVIQTALNNPNLSTVSPLGQQRLNMTACYSAQDDGDDSLMNTLRQNPDQIDQTKSAFVDEQEDNINKSVSDISPNQKPYFGFSAIDYLEQLPSNSQSPFRSNLPESEIEKNKKRTQTTQFRLGPITRNDREQDANNMKRFDETKTFYSFVYDRDKALVNEVRNTANDMRRLYTQTHFKLGFPQPNSIQDRSTSQQQLTKDLIISGQGFVQHSPSFITVSETKAKYPKYDNSCYKYNPRCQTRQYDTVKRYNHFESVKIAGQDSSFLSTQKQELELTSQNCANTINNRSILQPRLGTANLLNVTSPLQMKDVSFQHKLTNFKLGYTQPNWGCQTIQDKEAYKTDYNDNARVSYKIAQQRNRDNVREAFYNTSNSQSRPNTTLNDSNLRTCNSEFYKWIQPLLREKLGQALFELFNFIGTQELKIEKKREDLAKIDTFEPYSAFKRIARMGDQITKRDLYLFLQDNKRNYQSEDDCKFIVKYYDSDNDECINFLDFNFIVLVNDDHELRAKEVQQNMQFNKELDPNVEETLSELIEWELFYHIQTERMKRELEQMKGFSTVTAFQIMDVKRYNYLDWESIFQFLKSMAGGNKATIPSKRKVNAIFRRLDLNADVKIAFNEFAEAIKPVDVYFTEYKGRQERVIGEKTKRLNSSQIKQLKKEIKKEYLDNREEQKTKPLRTFKSILHSGNSQAKEELSHPIKRQDEVMIQNREPVAQGNHLSVLEDYSPVSSNKRLDYQEQFSLSRDNKIPSDGFQQRLASSERLKQSYYSPLKKNQQSAPMQSQKRDQVSLNEYSPITASHKFNASLYEYEKSQLNSSAGQTRLISHHMSKPDFDKNPFKKENESNLGNAYKPIQSRDIKSDQSDQYSPERYAQDLSQLNNIRYDMRTSMEQQHKNYPFSKLLVQILDSLKVIENEKELLFTQSKDFNVMDAFRVFDIDGKGWISQLELTTGLMNLKIKFSDFGKAFLPSDRDSALQILKRDPKNIKRDKQLDQVFSRQTLVQYMILWRIILRQTWEIEQKKKKYQSSNCFDAERVFFDMDLQRRGYIDKENFRKYIEQRSSLVKMTEKEVDLIYSYINRKDLPRISLDDFTAEVIVIS